MNRILILIFTFVMAGCSYQPWHYERYVIDRSGEVEARIKTETSLFTINVTPTRQNLDLAKSPYKVNLRYVDNTMELEKLNICSLSITTNKGRALYSSNACQEIAFYTPSYSEGVEPYANLASLSIPNIKPDFQASEKLLVKFSYSTQSNRTEVVSLVFLPVLDKGKFVSCCLPSV